MHVIDVNSGHKVTKKEQSAAALAVNLEAAEEISRQLRLRDIGGIIIIDFIDMKSPEHKKELLRVMRKFMSSDRAQHTILSLSKFGLMQITRQRVRPEVTINTDERCPTCHGTGKTAPTLLLTDQINRDLEYILQSRPKSKIKLTVHPFLHAYLKKGLPNKQMKWFMQFGKWIPVNPDTDLQLADYTFYDSNNDEIRLN